MGHGPEGIIVYSPEGEQTALKIARLRLFILWQMTSPGEPSLYDGDTARLLIGEDGHGDDSSSPEKEEGAAVREYYQTLLGLRNHYDVLRSGTWEVLHAAGTAYAYLRAIEGGRDSFG